MNSIDCREHAPETKFTLSTCVDSNPRLHAELMLWVVCATRLLPGEKFKIVVYLIDYRNNPLELWLNRQGIEVRFRDAPVPNIPHCNRLVALMDEHESDLVVVTDSDLYFVNDPSHLFLNSSLIRAAPNNACNPPPHIFKRLLSEAGLGRSYRPTFTLLPGATWKRETHINNISAGIVAIPGNLSSQFAKLWVKWAMWLDERRNLLELWEGHIDQIAFALACEDISMDVVFLPPQVNLILHLLDEVETVYAFHLSSAHISEFSGRFRQDKTLNPTGLSPDVVLAIEALNACIIDAVGEIGSLPIVCDSAAMFLNPEWRRN